MNFIRIGLGILLAALIAGPARAQEKGAPPTPQAAGPVKAPPPRIRVAGDAQDKNVVHRVYSVYPPRAASKNITGTVLLHVIISQDGTVQKVDYISGPKILKDAEMDAVKEWRYKPTMVNGEAVEVDTTVKMVYSL